jgi:hypothetical protein
MSTHHGFYDRDECSKYNSKVVSRWGGAPPAGIAVLCGSTKFYDEFQRVNYELTMRNWIVLSVGFYPHAVTESGGHGEGVGHNSVEKVALDELHKRKIDLADLVVVLNVGGYIGESTRSEIEYAAKHCKTVKYIEPPAIHSQAALEQMGGTCSICKAITLELK